MFRNFLIFICCLSLCKLFAQSPIDVAENTLKVGALSEEVFYYGFAQGDQIIFNFHEVDKKEIKEVEIFEYPSNSKFMDYKSKIIDNKIILAAKTAVYGFRLNNSGLTGRVCKIKIQRIPANEDLKFFSTTVKWIDRPDTTWNTYTKDVVVGHDTDHIQKTKKELVKNELTEELIMDKSQRVHSTSNSEGNKTHVFFSLPSYPESELVSKKVVSWAYWVGVGEEANQAWQQNSKIISGLITGVASAITTPLGGLLIGKITELALPKVGEDVGYGVVDATNKELFYKSLEYRGYDFGKGVAGYKKFSDGNMLSGTWFIVLSNDNTLEGIDANVKVVALVETLTHEYKPFTEIKVTPRYEKKIFKDPSITTARVPITTN